MIVAFRDGTCDRLVVSCLSFVLFSSTTEKTTCLSPGRLHPSEFPTTHDAMPSSPTPLLLAAALFLTDYYCHALAKANKPFIRKTRSAAPKRGRWYEDGLKFECTSCGKCCRVDGDVWLAPEEVERIITHLGYDDTDRDASIDHFRKRYVRAELTPSDGDQSQSWMCLKRKEGACVFLDQGGQCSIYDVRPVQCSTYPFWPSLLKNKEAWEDESVVPDNIVIDGTPHRRWSPDLGGCEGIILDKSNRESDVLLVSKTSNADAERGGYSVVSMQEIELKKKAAKKHWKRFPVDEIKETTWYL